MQTVQNTRTISGFLKLIGQSLKGAELDYTKISVTKGVIMLAIPMMLEMMMESVFALVDLYFVGHLKESSFAIQTVGLTESVLAIMYSIAIGMSMAANKFDGIRAALCHNEYSARMARKHNDANVLCLGERVSGEGMIEAIIKAWDKAEFEEGRHTQRVEKINALSKIGNCRA